MTSAGITFDVMKPDVDEAALKSDGQRNGLNLDQIAQNLADAKATAHPPIDDRPVLASDQILEFNGQGFDKPQSMAQARARLLALSGSTHSLINAISIAQRGEIVFRHIDRPKLLVRVLTANEIDAYLDQAGEEILESVGAYQVENLGARLFDRIEGDYFAVLGLSIFPVLAFLRQNHVIDF